jgi:Tfp pilus assembly protein PilO
MIIKFKIQKSKVKIDSGTVILRSSANWRSDEGSLNLFEMTADMPILILQNICYTSKRIMEGFRKKLVFLIVMSLGLFLVSGFLLFYFIKDINTKVEKANISQQEILQKSELLDKVQKLERESHQAEPYFPLLYQALPTESEVITLEGKLKNLASIYNLNTFSFRFGTLQEAQDNEPKSYSFNLLIEGTADALMNWLEAFDKLPYTFRLEQIEMTQNVPSVGHNPAIYKIQILGRIYLR